MTDTVTPGDSSTEHQAAVKAALRALQGGPYENVPDDMSPEMREKVCEAVRKAVSGQLP